jgi:hypothetical protein
MLFVWGSSLVGRLFTIALCNLRFSTHMWGLTSVASMENWACSVHGSFGMFSEMVA